MTRSVCCAEPALVQCARSAGGPATIRKATHNETAQPIDHLRHVRAACRGAHASGAVQRHIPIRLGHGLKWHRHQLQRLRLAFPVAVVQSVHDHDAFVQLWLLIEQQPEFVSELQFDVFDNLVRVRARQQQFLRHWQYRNEQQQLGNVWIVFKFRSVGLDELLVFGQLAVDLLNTVDVAGDLDLLDVPFDQRFEQLIEHVHRAIVRLVLELAVIDVRRRIDGPKRRWFVGSLERLGLAGHHDRAAA